MQNKKQENIVEVCRGEFSDVTFHTNCNLSSFLTLLKEPLILCILSGVLAVEQKQVAGVNISGGGVMPPNISMYSQ